MVASLQGGYGEIGAGVKRLMYVVWCVCVCVGGGMRLVIVVSLREDF